MIIEPRDAGDVGQDGCLFHEVDQLFHHMIGHATVGEIELPKLSSALKNLHFKTTLAVYI